ncbi:hypothetical protein [Nannocystis pusilla]|uniref:hypothetical protein n=1 Tax=Nannocystis pusilla TaxID=889268 RepID=UPI003B826745
MPDLRMMPNPTLPRAELDARLRALGYAHADLQPRTHLGYRLQTWRHPAGSSVILCEAHVLGERCAIVHAETLDELTRALETVPYADLLQAAAAAPSPARPCRGCAGCACSSTTSCRPSCATT